MNTFWHVTTPNWAKSVDSKEEADQLIQEANSEGFKWDQITCTEHFQSDKAFVTSLGKVIFNPAFKTR